MFDSIVNYFYPPKKIIKQRPKKIIKQRHLPPILRNKILHYINIEYIKECKYIINTFERGVLIKTNRGRIEIFWDTICLRLNNIEYPGGKIHDIKNISTELSNLVIDDIEIKTHQKEFFMQGGDWGGGSDNMPDTYWMGDVPTLLIKITSQEPIVFHFNKWAHFWGNQDLTVVKNGKVIINKY